MYCNQCGRKIPEDAVFCEYCGAQASAEIRQEAPAAGARNAAAPGFAPVNPPAANAAARPDVQNAPLYPPVQTPVHRPVQAPVPQPKKSRAPLIAALSVAGGIVLMTVLLGIGITAFCLINLPELPAVQPGTPAQSSAAQPPQETSHSAPQKPEETPAAPQTEDENPQEEVPQQPEPAQPQEPPEQPDENPKPEAPQPQTPQPPAGGDPVISGWDSAFWDQDFYGFVLITNATGEFSSGISDFCMEMFCTGDTGEFNMWAESCPPGNVNADGTFLLTDGVTTRGSLLSTDVWLNGAENLMWEIDPGTGFSANFSDMICIGGYFEDKRGTYQYSFYFRPWGTLWDDVEAEYPELVPRHYYDWYLPKISAGEPMPDTFGLN